MPAVAPARLPALLDELAAAGLPVAVVAAGDVDLAAVLAGLPAGAQLCVPVGHVAATSELARAAARRDVQLVLRVPRWTGPVGTVVTEVRRRLPAVGVQLDVRSPGTEELCRELAGDVQLISAALPPPPGALPTADTDLAAARCLDVLLAGPARVSVDGADPQLARLAVERAAWHARPHVPVRRTESWELLVPHHRPTPPLPAPVRALVPVTGSAA